MTLFSDLKLDQNVLKAINEVGYDKPTPIQAGAIPPALQGRDVLGIAQTGTGKTASFTLPVITLLSRGRARARMPRSLVLAPTRELAAQVAENFDLYAKYTRLTKALLIGGVSFSEQDKLIDRGVDVLIATPGRLLDHFERGKLLLTGVQIMVVDEADRMLDMGFIPDIERIFQLTPATRQTLFFSATMAPEIERITNTFLHSPERIEVARQATTSENIEQRLIELKPTRKDQAAKQKRELLRAIIISEGDALKNAIIFSNRKTDVDIVAKSLRVHGYDAQAIHGDLDQNHRTKTLDDFREGRLRFLVASDVAARGLDIPAVSHVFNYDLPSHAEDYVHRIGRTGRAGLKGTAISISVPSDEKYLTAIENLVKHTLPRTDVPEGFKLAESPRNTEVAPEQRSSRSRTRSRNPRNEEAATPPADVEAPVAREPVAAQQSRAPQQRNSADEERRRSNNQNGRQGDRSRGGVITGMGDHVPEFMTRSFYDALQATERASAENSAQAAGQPAKDEAAPTEASASGRPTSPRRNNRRRGTAANQTAHVPTAEAQEVPSTETVSGVDTAPPQPNAEAVIEPAAVVAKNTADAEPAADTKVAAVAAESAPVEASVKAEDEVAEVKKPAPRTRTRRTTSRSTTATKAAEPEATLVVSSTDVPDATPADDTSAAPVVKPAATPKRAPARKTPATPRATKAQSAATEATPETRAEAVTEAAATEASPTETEATPAKPTTTARRRTSATRKTAANTETEAATPPEVDPDAPPAPKPRATRAKTTTAAKPAVAKNPATRTAATKATATKTAGAKTTATKTTAAKATATKAAPKTPSASKAATAKPDTAAVPSDKDVPPAADGETPAE